MNKYKCEYEGGFDLNIKKWKSSVEAADHDEAYKIFLNTIGIQNRRVWVYKGLFDGGQFFDDHIEAEKHENEKAEREQSESQETKKLEDLDIEYQESGWASFLNFCGFLNLILFVIGGIWLFNAGSNDQFMAMNLMIIGLAAGINSFFFAFLVNTFTRIQHNTHLTTLELIKLNKKNDSHN